MIKWQNNAKLISSFPKFSSDSCIQQQEYIPVGCVPAKHWPYSGVWSWGGVYPQRKEKSKKNSPSQKKLGGPPLTTPLNPPLTPPQPPPENWRPPKIGDTPPKNWRHPPPKNWRHPRDWLARHAGIPPQDWPARHAGIPTPSPGTDLQGMLGYPPTPLWTDTRLWKYYLGQNFVSAGNNYAFVRIWVQSSTQTVQSLFTKT